jgi:hypothetical protein
LGSKVEFRISMRRMEKLGRIRPPKSGDPEECSRRVVLRRRSAY